MEIWKAIAYSLFYTVLGIQLHLPEVEGVHLTTYLSSGGIHGSISLYQDPEPGLKPVHLIVDLVNRNQFEGNQTWTWFVAEFPVDYSTLQDRCNSDVIGGLVSDLGDLFGPITFVSNESVYFEFDSTTQDFALVGPKGVWGRSLVLLGPEKEKVCGTITVSDEREEWVAEARFRDGLAGSVYLGWVGSTRINVSDNMIYSHLMHTTNSTHTKNPWKIYVTDILDSKADQARANCDFLQILFNPGDMKPAVGDLSERLGAVTVGSITMKGSISSRSLYRNTGLNLLPADLSGTRRSLYLVIFDDKHQDSFLACAKIRPLRPTVLKGLIQSKGVVGTIAMSQRTRFYPTSLVFNVTGPEYDPHFKVGVKIHEMPPHPDIIVDRCATTKDLYNPLKLNNSERLSQDHFAVGDLDGKYGEKEYIGSLQTTWDTYLPLHGPHSVAHRSIILYRDAKGSGAAQWICATLNRYVSLISSISVPMITAQAIYRYPIVAKVIFRQPAEQPWTDTSIIVETMVHADGRALNNSFHHRWSINEFPPGRDFYNWSKRCLSAGDTFNPYDVTYDATHSHDYCSESNSITCRLGDLTNRIGTIAIAGAKKFSEAISRRLFTDSFLPLSGLGSVLGKSLVIFDDYGPVARGERLACSKIHRQYSRKGVIKNWFGNGQQTTVTGKIEFLQQSKYDITNIDVKLEGLSEVTSYDIHMVPVQEDLEFPCEESTIYGHYNPIGVNSLRSPPMSTPDDYETGDISGKFGSLDGKSSVHASYNDSTVTMYGPLSILGRSLVIHKRKKNGRWTCSNIERGYAPSEARELRAIASFHHPNGFAYGYIRMTQLVYRDGGMSDTIMEVNLRYPGKNDRNYTRNHNWAMFVNPVSVDATVKIFNTRCTAGGYVWNPYYTQLADPLNEDLYKTECGPDNPLRCYVGDLSGRLGTIEVGGKRQIFSDDNVPLEGELALTAMGRSIIIYTPNHGADRMACANIEPDKDIIKYANVRSSPGFVADLFLKEIREVMGIPEWFLTIDTRQTKSLYQGNCVQFLLHFKGPDAGLLEQDFSRLLATGSLAQASIYIPGYVNAKRRTITSYRTCGNEDPLEAAAKKKKKNYFSYNSCSSRMPTVLLFCVTLLLVSLRSV